MPHLFDVGTIEDVVYLKPGKKKSEVIRPLAAGGDS